MLVGVPGLAKTLLVNTIADALGLSFNRIQFTPDLMPSDIVGAEILDENRMFRFVKGPLFANIILADEINRTPPKTQSALLEAMQEKQQRPAGLTRAGVMQTHAIRQRRVLTFFDGSHQTPSPRRPARSLSRTCGAAS